MSKQETIVIVGGVAGGASAATRARRCNEDARIIIFEMGEHVSFANCGLPYYLGGEIEDRKKLLVATPELLRNRFNLEVHTKHKVIAIDRAGQTVRVLNLDTDEEFDQDYDRLILAPGARPIVPPLEGTKAPNVFTLRNLEDADRIKKSLDTGWIKRAVVVGAGFIGLEMAEQLHKLGIKVTVVDLAPQVLAPLDPEMASPICRRLIDNRIDVKLGSGLRDIRLHEGSATGVVLQDGTELDADLVILAIGVTPNTELAEQVGLELGKMGGITVNETMQTTDPKIYAVGDVCEYANTFLGVPMRVPLAGPANRAGRIAGEHAATGHAQPMGPVLGTAIVRVLDQTVAMTGLTEKLADRFEIPVRSVTIVADNHAGYYPGAKSMLLKLVYAPQTGKVLGAQIVGRDGVDKRIDIIATAIRFGASVHDLAELDLSYAPPFGSAKDPVHLAAFAATNERDGLVKFVPPDADIGELQVLDIRNKKEVAKAHLIGSVHIELETLRAKIDDLDRTLPTVVVCQTGLRAHTAARILMQHGFENVVILSGGMVMRRNAHPDDIVAAAPLTHVPH